jgi:hypothetical protein
VTTPVRIDVATSGDPAYEFSSSAVIFDLKNGERETVAPASLPRRSDLDRRLLQVDRMSLQRPAARRYNSRMPSTPVAARTFRLTLDLFDAGVRLMRQNLRRRDPAADEQEIDRKLGAWLRERPGAEHGDSAGRQVHIDTRIG